MNNNNFSSPPNGAENRSNNIVTSNNNRTPASSSSRASTNRSSARVPHTRRFAGYVAGMNGHAFQVHNEQASKTQFLRTMQELKTYVAQCYKFHVSYLSPLFQDEIGTPSVPKPDALPADADDIDKAGFQEDIQLWVKDKRILKKTLVSLFDVIWAQCSPMMQAKLKAEFTAKGKSIDDKDVTLLLKAIKGVSHRFD